MNDFQPHSFDVRGFLWSLVCLALVIGLVVAGRYGVVIAWEHFDTESQIAAVETVDFTPKVTEASAAEVEANVPSRFVIDAPLPTLSAHSYILADMDSDGVFAQKNGTTVFPIASITKLLTALVAREQLAASSTITITEADRAATLGTPGSVQRDETFSLEDSFYPLLTESNNSIAYALARTKGTTTFMDAMRAKAKDIGMTLTSLEDPSGISQHNAASALDIYLLARHMYVHAPDLFDMTRARNKSIEAKSGRAYTFSNFNTVYETGNYLGGKIGYTDAARQTMTTIFQVSVSSTATSTEHATATIGITVLGTNDRKGDTEALLRWFKKNARLASTTPKN
jgi:serine-type D-Ala-D-Ala endopeptidase (penicillin-binding protein 7)